MFRLCTSSLPCAGGVKRSVGTEWDAETDKTILVPLTNSLYVPGKLKDTEHVIVDVGTGYYVKKVRPIPDTRKMVECDRRRVVCALRASRRAHRR